MARRAAAPEASFNLLGRLRHRTISNESKTGFGDGKEGGGRLGAPARETARAPPLI